ncbi:Tol-Pal system beta propeller repeat protein TolB [Rhodobaculum claviforme]|uniref:Tol-Pal system protein TolB n=1 Tax=Rhodobaculum claviforme TaxID=1549854 RepID=A0A934WIZ9_9RHOB|nr:Tol-Pal system beta propeller repeat protein TolB [Rhodobaculum claviforme]MBK5928650.1 Tol-Pal system beta propeller repeat protein TolB [Rhodobaculum claviforme]
MTLTRRSALMLPAAAALLPGAVVPRAHAQSGPLRIEITEGVIEPVPLAIPDFVAETGSAAPYTAQIARVVANNLTGTGLFREIPASAHIGRITAFDAPVSHADWRAINAQALVTGAVGLTGDRIVVKFRLFDVVSGRQMGEGLQFAGSAGDWRRMGHRVSDAVYSRITGEGGYFDTRIAFVAETGPRDRRVKRLALMDQDGANVRMLTDGRATVLSPRFSPAGDRLLYTSFEAGAPRIMVMALSDMRPRALHDQGGMTFSPRFAPDGQTVIFSMARGGTTDLYTVGLTSGRVDRLTSDPSISTSPSFSPDGRQIVFESDRAGTQQLYVMPAGGGAARRISRGSGRYATPVWSPRGDMVAFTKSDQGRFHIGVMRVDGSEERLLTASFLDEGPNWAPNGRVIVFTREPPGGNPALWSVDISGRNLRRLPTETAASDPSWSPLLG